MPRHPISPGQCSQPPSYSIHIQRSQIYTRKKSLRIESSSTPLNQPFALPTLLHRNAKYTISLPPTHMGTSTRRLKIGIIGFGPFAQFLAKTMMKQGHVLRATSRSDHSGHVGVQFSRDMEEFMGLEHDVIMICTSIVSLSEVVKSLPFGCLKKATMFADVLSVKEHPRQLLLQEIPEDSDLVCTHPMFGPESGRDGWKDLTFMYERVRVRDEELCSSFLRIFECEGCKMVEMSCEEHDRLAAQSQFLTHTIGRILAEMEITNTSIDTKGFEKLVQVKESTTRDSFDLYSGLFIHNRFAKQQLEHLESALQRVKEKLEARTNNGDGPKYS